MTEVVKLDAHRRETVYLVGGPLDGAEYETDMTEVKEYLILDMPVETTEGSLDEPYVFRALRSDDGLAVEWYLVWAPLVKLPDRDPDPARMRAAWGAQFGNDAHLLTAPCEPGTHEWSMWLPTPKGNHVRHCEKCQVSQARVT